MAQLLELARRIWGSNPTKEQIEITRHEMHNHDYDDIYAYDIRPEYERDDWHDGLGDME
jgi:hypothetical protein